MLKRLLRSQPLLRVLIGLFNLSGLALAQTDATSADVRASKQWQVAARAGNFLGGIFGVGLEAGRLQNHTWQYSVVAMTGSMDLRDKIEDDPVISLDKFRADGQVVLALVRGFIGNSFYVSGGLGLRRVSFLMKISDRDSSEDGLDISGEATSAIVQLNVGNAWAWDSGLYLGADWIGYSAPFAKSYRSSVKARGVISDSVDEFSELVEDTAEDLGSLPSSQALVLTAGIMF